VDSVALPAGFTLHPRLKRGHVDARLSALESATPDIDWATAEVLAYGSLVRDGYNLRLCGQDVERGTFSQRHHVLTDQKTDATLMPMLSAAHRLPKSGRFQTVNTHLSEFAALGFEFGYSWENPRNLNVWEAQFGDFNNGAQIIIDTFLATTEVKWLRASGLIMLLPHGYDGAGPEHSSSRVERFLQMTDDVHDFPLSNIDGVITGGGQPRTNSPNMLIANVTTPANYFHLLRRQMLRTYRKPLIVVTPKTLLRLPEAVSSLEEMAPGSSFKVVLGDAMAEKSPASMKAIKRVVFISGKVYYDLISKRSELKRNDIAFIRLEELCPFPFATLLTHIAKYTSAEEFVWFQEEPSNMGAWSYVQPRLAQLMLASKETFRYVGRNALPMSAVGAAVYHKKEVEQIYTTVFAA
jgi:probable 2-oxoglutarate dehydrogenase E1 component DHKTD1